MTYVDTSVALAYLLGEDRSPPDSLWGEALVSSRLLEYEIWVPLNARGLADAHGESARWLIGQVAMLELVPAVLGRALEPFPGPTPVRTLDALHLASCIYLIERGQAVDLASFDGRMIAVANELGIATSSIEDHGM